MAFSIVIPQGQHLVVTAGGRHTVIKFKELDMYFGERGQRGLKLPRGFQKVDKVEIGS
jgi:topoisomerase-4 subunit A